MATKKPSKLSDIFNMTNAVKRPRKDGTQSRLGRTLDIDGITSRFQRNKVLIDPKSFHLMTDYDTLRKYKVFGTYKPPFAPMRRSESFDNHHRVSLESYIAAALKSKDMEGVVSALKRGEDPNAPYRAPSSFDPSKPAASASSSSSANSNASNNNLQIRVINDLPMEVGGPVLVHLNDPSLYVHNDHTRYNYECMVYGHVSLRDVEGIERAMAIIVETTPPAPADPDSPHHLYHREKNIVVGAGGYGSLPGESDVSGGVSAAALDGQIRTGYAGTTAAIGNAIETSNLALLYPSLMRIEQLGAAAEGNTDADAADASSLSADGASSSSSASHSSGGIRISTVDLPRQRTTTVPRRSLSPSMMKAARQYLEENHPQLAQRADSDMEAYTQMREHYKQLMEEHRQEVAEYEEEIARLDAASAAYDSKMNGNNTVGTSSRGTSGANVGIMPAAGEKNMPTPSSILEAEMNARPARPTPPPPPPEPTIPIAAPPRNEAPSLRVAIKNFGFYATHPVTLIRFSAQAPGTAAAPDVLKFMRAVTGSYIVGDPMAKRDVNNKFVKSLRAGDKDFPRVLVNLRSMGVNVYQRNLLWGDEALLSSASRSAAVSNTQRQNDLALASAPWLHHPKYLEFACDGALDSLISDSQLNMKKGRICLTDGYWNPAMHAGM